MSSNLTPRARWSAGLAVLLWLVLGSGAHAARYGSAFPGAEGYGSKSRGGRGGRVLIVDSLEDKVGKPAPGTLRWAIRVRRATRPHRGHTTSAVTTTSTPNTERARTGSTMETQGVIFRLA